MSRGLRIEEERKTREELRERNRKITEEEKKNRQREE